MKQLLLTLAIFLNVKTEWNNLELPFNLEKNKVQSIFFDGKLYSQTDMPLPQPINKNSIDLSIISTFVRFNGSLCRQSISLLEAILPHQLNVNIIGNAFLDDIKNKALESILKNTKKNNPVGNVSILEDVIFTKNFNGFKNIPKDSHIKLAYTMFESSRIPQIWVSYLNQLDGLVVPDQYIKKIYIKSGITVPVFVVPLSLYLQGFLDLPKKTTVHEKFTFGCIAMEISRKNIEKVIEAFHQAFGRSKKVQLIIKVSPSRETKPNYLENFIIKRWGKNIKLIRDSFDWQGYIKLMSSFDCYVYPSKGEGFSNTPREAMAAGIPCILTNNTAQKTICKSGLVKVIESKIKEPASYFWFSNNDLKECGNHFNCNQEDLSKAMLEVYNNYEQWLTKAYQGREWAKQYLPENLSLKYLNVIKPKTIILGTENIITNQYLMTTSKELFEKYVQLQI
jgi:glycosyltransferase involved in cell wall biosynthesis